MAEAVAVIGVLSSILQVVDFTARVVSHAKELITSGKDALRENIETERLARESAHIAGLFQREDFDGLSVEHENILRKKSADCQERSRRLLDLLEKLKLDPAANGLKRWAAGTSKAVRAIAKRGAIEQYRKELQNENQLLATLLLQAVYARQSRRPLAAAHPYPYAPSSGKNEDERAAQNEQRALLLSSHQKIRHILMNLNFPEMGTRHGSIQETYSHTYRWILEDDQHGFKSWLASGHGIFWISGKPGSGKSTLMKFLSDDRTTKDLLTQWSNGTPYLFASFYFWYLGTKLQKSITGLLRSILYQLLLSNPAVAPLAFPVESKIKPADFVGTAWSQEELVKALMAIAQVDNSQFSCNVCLFIDGLDEYVGFELDIIKLVQSLAQHDRFKICVSSRPWNAFRAAFETKAPNINLEDLTKLDIHNYVSGSLREYLVGTSAAAQVGLNGLISDITSHAEGVFLWVMLVVQAVLQGFAEGDDIVSLRHRVQTFPPDLDGFFESILDRVHYSYSARTAQALKLIWLTVHFEDDAQQSSNLVDHWMISKSPLGLYDLTFPYRESYQPISDSIGQVDAGLSCTYVIAQTRQFLGATTKGLLRLSSDNVQAAFLHRTVYDFLNTDAMQAKLDKMVPASFKGKQILHLLGLARLQHPLPESFDPQKAARVEATIAMSIEKPHEDLTIQYLQLFHKLIAQDHSTIWDLGVSGALAQFAAIGMTECMTAWEKENSQRVGIASKALFNKLSAAMGANRNHSPLAVVSLELLQSFIRPSMNIGILQAVKIWGMFLQRWTGTVKPSCPKCPLPDDSCPQQLSRYGWEIAKTILDAPICVPPLKALLMGQSVYANDHYVRRDFVLAHVPGEWIDELEPYRMDFSPMGIFFEVE